jgi:hypothetical protein
MQITFTDSRGQRRTCSLQQYALEHMSATDFNRYTRLKYGLPEA